MLVVICVMGCVGLGGLGAEVDGVVRFKTLRCWESFESLRVAILY